MDNIGHIAIIVGIIGIIKNYKKNIIILLCIELILIGISILFLDSALKNDNMDGIITSIFILCISATESALGLTILLKNN